MNEKYLWSKEGSDPDIESLEGLLEEFRFRPGELPFRSRAGEEVSRFSLKRFAWVFGLAAPTFALALFAFWLFTSIRTGDLQARTPENVNPTTNIQNDFAEEKPIAISVGRKDHGKQPRERKPTPANIRTIYRPKRSKVDRSGSLIAMRLTREEKYAYDRLMLALSIAGTKLKVVQDAVDGNEGKVSTRNTK